MNTKQANPVIDQLQAAGLNMSLGDDGKVLVNNPAQLTDDLRDLIRSNKPMLIDWLRTAPATVAANDPAPDADQATGTRRPTGLSKKLLAASKALDKQILDSGKSLTPPEQPRPKLAASNPAKVNAVDPPTIKRTDDNGWLKPDATWKTLAQAYYLHHSHCPHCIAAGLKPGKYQRCATGTTLWATYQSAIQ